MIADAFAALKQAREDEQQAEAAAIQDVIARATFPCSGLERWLEREAVDLLKQIRSEANRRAHLTISGTEWQSRALAALRRSKPYYADAVCTYRDATKADKNALAQIAPTLQKELGELRLLSPDDLQSVSLLPRDPAHRVDGVQYRIAPSSLEAVSYLARESFNMPPGARAGFLSLAKRDWIETNWEHDDAGLCFTDGKTPPSRFSATADWQYFAAGMLSMIRSNTNRGDWQENFLTRELLSLFRQHPAVRYQIGGSFVETRVSVGKQMPPSGEALRGDIAMLIICSVHGEALPRVGACFLEAKKVELFSRRCHDLHDDQIRRLSMHSEYGRLLTYDWWPQSEWCICTSLYAAYLAQKGTQRTRLDQSMRPFADDLFENVFLCRQVDAADGAVDAAMHAINYASTGLAVLTGVGDTPETAQRAVRVLPQQVIEIERMVHAIRRYGPDWQRVLQQERARMEIEQQNKQRYRGLSR